MLAPFKPYLTKLAKGPMTANTRQRMANIGLSAGLHFLAALREMYDYTLYLCARNHYISFCTFDTAALLCSALYHDPHRTLAQRSEEIEAIGQAAAYLDKGRETVPGAKSFHKILTSLTDNLSLGPHERAGMSPSPYLTTDAREQQHPPNPTITSNPLDSTV